MGVVKAGGATQTSTQTASKHAPCARCKAQTPALEPFIGSVKACPGPACPQRDGRYLVDSVARSDTMLKSEFLTTLRREIHAAAEVELAGTDWTSVECPWLTYWFSYYERRSAADVEATLRKFAPSVRDAVGALEYIEPVVARVRTAIAHWRATGEVDGPTVDEVDPAVAQVAALGPGRPLESAVRSRLEHSVGESLSEVRVHDDARAHRAAAREDATAFAVGQHIAFAPNAYQPGTISGELLLAHEVAHTLQQRGATRSRTTSVGHERDANLTAIRMVTGSRARPQARGGLSLQRCKKEDRFLPPARGDTPNYDAFSDKQGTVPAEGPMAEQLGAMFQNPAQLDRVFSDAAKGDHRAAKVVEQLHQDFEALGVGVAQTEYKPDCLIPAWHELKTVVTTGCEPHWGYLSFLDQNRPGGAALLEDVARGYSRTARAAGVRNSIIVNGLNLLLVGWQARATLQGEARALEATANTPVPRPKPAPAPVPPELADLPAADAAEAAKLPKLPDGYRWGKKDGKFTINRMPGRANDLPQLKYDPATGEIFDADELKPPKPAVVRPGTPPPDLEVVADEAIAARDNIPDAGKKTVARTPDGATQTSGWGGNVDSLDPVFDLSRKIGHEPKPNPKLDAPGHPGSYNASHAEKKLAAQTNGDLPIGVSREMCMDCQNFFQRLANYKNKPIVVADPAGIRVFYPDGTYVSAATKAGLMAAVAARANKPGAKP